MSTSQIGFILTLANIPYLCIRATPGRKGLTLVNPHPTAILYVSVGAPLAQAECVPVMPRGNWVMDIVTAPEAVYAQTDTAGSVIVTLESL